MKQQLRQIYDDLSRGEISQSEALERIRAVKRHDRSDGFGVLLAAPAWRDVAVPEGARPLEVGEHHILLCDLPPLDSLLPHAQCVTLHASRETTIAQRYSEAALTAFDRIQDILLHKQQGRVLMQIAVPDRAEQTLLAGLSGLLKTAALENPRFIGQVVLVPHDSAPGDLARWLRSETGGAVEAVVRYRDGVRQVLEAEEVSTAPGTPIAFRDRGLYLITGGLGRLGTLFAREILARTREARVVLTGRLQVSDGWFTGSERVSYRQADLGDPHQVGQLIESLQQEATPLDGILHCAGMTADDFLLRKSAAAFRQVLEPKVAGTLHLDHATRHVELDFFVLFSSIAAAVGNPGQGDYAAANGFMDQFSAYRNGLVAAGQRHGRTRSIAWPLWQAGGMTLDPASQERWRELTGIHPMQTATGIDAFHRSLALPHDQLLVVEGELAQMRRAFLGRRPVERPVSSTAPPVTAGVNLAGKTEELLLRECAEILKLPAQRIDPQAPLAMYGIDSILAMKLTGQLEKTFGSLSKTLFFEYQTIRELAGYFAESHAARLATLFSSRNDDDAAAQTKTLPLPGRRASHRRGAAAPAASMKSEGIAIIGMSGRYPEAVDLAAYWKNLREGKDCVIEVPRERWDWREYFTEDRTSAGHHYSKWGGFIAGVDEFDPMFFNISPKEAKYIDPQERLFLQHAWMAIEDAGYTRAALQVPCEGDLPGQAGVYAGVMYSEYQLFGAESSLRGKRAGIAGSVASIANRVSFALNLHGPSMTLDTMCSSSLTAIHLACQDLRLGRTTLAIAGGVNVTLHPNKYLALSAGQFISSDGHCQSFGEGGDGYIPGEGVGVVVLKRLSDAERDGDHIHGIIRGSALNHGGRTNGYTVPNPQAQAGAIARALAESQTDPRHISYIEAHGTGTKLGDPIEIAALTKAFQQSTPDTGFCLIGSAKSNIGHCESAAGIAGLTKVLLQMQHQEIVPSLHSAQLNPHIDFPRTPFVVNQTVRPWEQPVVEGRTLPRIAGISSFGAGGSNAHLIVEEYRRLGPQPVQQAPAAIVLSARTAAQLQQKTRELLELVRARRSSIDLLSMAFTLQTGREAMEERLGIFVTSVDQLLQKLEAYVAGTRELDGVYEGQVKRGKDALSLFSSDTDLQETVGKWIANRKLAKLLELWVKGLELDWRMLYDQPAPQRISLPAYPFAKERYWIDVPSGGIVPAHASARPALHPLLHANTSDLEEQRYSSTFRGDELFLSLRVLPAAACLEMARAAVERALPERSEAAVLELRNVTWTEAVALAENQPVSIALFANGEEETEFEIYTRDAEGEILLCAGRAAVHREAPPATLDLARLERQIGSTQSLARLRVPEDAKDGGGYVLHPAILNDALQTAVPSGCSSNAAALDTLRVFGPCAGEMVVWVRAGAGGVDIDLCDERGSIRAELRGVRYAPVAAVAALLPATPERISIAARAPREIALAGLEPDVSAPIGRRKPAAIALAAPGEALIAPVPRSARPAIKLAGTGAEAGTREASSVRLYDKGDGVFAIELTASAGMAHLRQALERVQQEPSIKVLTVRGVEHGFKRGDDNATVEQQLHEAIASFPYPVVAIVPAETTGAGFLFAALCDFMVCSEEARYGYANARHALHPTPAVVTLLSARFGETRALDLLLMPAASGRELRAKGWTWPIVPAAQVEAEAETLVATLATKARPAVRLLKQHLSQRLVDAVHARIEASSPTVVDAKSFAFTATHLHLEMQAQDVLVVTLLSADELAIAELGRLFAHIDQGSSCNAVVLTGELSGIAENLVHQLRRIIIEATIPVIATAQGNVTANAWLVSLFCDAAVYSRTASHSAAGITNSETLAPIAAVLFPWRLGEAGREVVLTGADYTGAALERRAAALTVVEQHDVLPMAVSLATSWAEWPRATFASWKQRAATLLAEKTGNLPPWLQDEGAEEARIFDSVQIPLQSRVVRATAHPGGIVVVRMEDRDAKNMFSAALMAGMQEVFAHIDRTRAYKVVILTGYDQYFASGGTKESLLAIHAGTSRFTDQTIFRLPLDCRLPVIAAMQGHGIGAGWSLGLFADLALMSEESHYVSPYMDYGFTPGAGATWSLPDKLGPDLARESLLTAQPATGMALKSRGLLLPVVPRAEVESAAMALAGQIARMPRPHLLALKRQWSASLQEPVAETLRREVAMHEVTFVGQADALTRIQNSFRKETAATPRTNGAANPPGSDGDALTAVTAILRTLLANELQMQESVIDDEAQFVDLGLDSISGVSWIRRINAHYGTSIEATKVYSHPTLTQLGRYVQAEAETHGALPVSEAIIPPAPGEVVAPPPATRTPRQRRRTSRAASTATRSRRPQPVAIIGMAGQFPRAKNLDELWRNLADGRDCVTEVPRHRWDVDALYQSGGVVAGKTNSRWAGTLEEFDRFDPLFFNISPAEAEFMDPQQRLFLQACWHSVENAGYAASQLSGSKCGVFVGCATGDYQELSRRHRLSAQGFTGNATSILAARISYFMNLQGPCVSIDTACSSSLVAIGQACDSLNSGDSDLALAGGVYVMSGPEMHIRTAQSGMLSPEGKCFTFDQRADGFVPGEGVGVVVLKRLADAERDRDIIYGLVEGWGVNQDGRTNGITSPNPESQTRLMLDVYEKHAIDPAGIQLIEAHGTGTKLGDPIEVEGLKASFRRHTKETGICALGSVKSNIGHCLTAAGIAGTLKLLLALQHRQLPPTINFERLNEHIDLSDSPFYVNTRLEAWEPKGAARRQAAISSFGFSGTNAHLVIGEYRPSPGVEQTAPAVPAGTPALVPLSARTASQLQQKGRDLLELLRNAPLDLPEIAYTLQTGREAMDERVAFVVSSFAELAERLQAWIDGERTAAHQGHARRGKEVAARFGGDSDLQRTIDSWIAGRSLAKLADLWAEGVAFDWNRLYDRARPRRIALPLYPFAKERYWIDAAEVEIYSGEGEDESETDSGALCAVPQWQASEVAPAAMEFAERHILLCELPGADAGRLASLLPHSHCASVEVGPQENMARRYSAHAIACFENLQTVLARNAGGPLLVQIVVADDEEHAVLAGLSGILKTAALEHARLSGQLILVPPGITTDELHTLLRQEQGLDPLVRFAGGARQVLRWEELEEATELPPIAFKDDGLYLITGGLGGLGLLFAREILERVPHARVVLTGRSAATAETRARLDVLSPHTSRVTYRPADLGDLGQVSRLIAELASGEGQLRGILHCAGMTVDNFIARKTSAEFAAVLAPKVAGTVHLDEATRDVALDFFVLFSSVASAFGNPGQADYATANGFMDHFAARRNRQVSAQQRHGRTRAIHWPLWQSGGMTIDHATRELVQQTIGARPMQTATGLLAFHRAMALASDQMLVVEGDRPRIRAYLQKARMLESEPDGGIAAPESESQSAISLSELQQQIKAAVAAVLRIDPSVIDADQPFAEFGLDSFLGAELIVAINRKYGTALSHSRLFDYSTVREFAAFLDQEIRNLPGHSVKPAPAVRKAPVKAAALPKTQRTVPASRTAPERIAIIGMSGRYPQANDLRQYWANLAAARNSIVEVPAERWDVNLYYDSDRTRKDTTYSRWLGAVDDFDRFDPLFFRISPQEAEYMDPQHRLFLQESYRAFEDAGYGAAMLSNRKCGVYLGISTSEYMSLLSEKGILSAPVTSNSAAIAAARIAYYLNLKGPAISVDTACSSSLVAIHLASQALLNGEIDMALAGGVSLWFTPGSYVAMSQAGMFSPDGQCKTFDESANGIVNGEGVGAVVLKRLADAEAAGDQIYGVILGSGINQDGRTNGITAPSVNSQIELERSIYARHQIDPETISYVETHGTGTKLGDPIELEALSTVFREKTSRRNFCALGSVKSNIGHTTSAAGVAGLQKVLLSMRHRTLVPTLNVTKENARFDLESSPFYISRETKPWEVAPGSLRRAAVSSFGFSGTNAHLVVEEYVTPLAAPLESSPSIIPLSARTGEQLRQKAHDLLDFIRTAQEPLELASIAWTLQTGREAMEERLACVVSSVDQLVEKLAAWVSGEKEPQGVVQGRIEPGSDGMAIIGGDDDMREAVDRWVARGKLAALAGLWIRGLELDWNKLHGDAKPRRITLPTYPFARERCWIDGASSSAGIGAQIITGDDWRSIERIIEQIADDAIETGHAVQALRMLV